MFEPLLFTTASIATLTLFVYGLVVNSKPFWISGLLGYLLGAPLILDLFLSLIACCHRSVYKGSSTRATGVFPFMPRRFQTLYLRRHFLVYGKNYDLTFCGIEKCHPAETTKYSKSYKHAVASSGDDGAPLFNHRLVVHRTSAIPRAQLIDAGVSIGKLLALNWVIYIVKAIEVPLLMFPASILRWRILQPMLEGT